MEQRRFAGADVYVERTAAALAAYAARLQAARQMIDGDAPAQ